MRPLLLLFGLVTLLGGCDSGTPACQVGIDPACTTPPDEIVAGVNLTALLRDPTLDEIAAVRADWATRDRQVQGVSSVYSVELVTAFRQADGSDVRVYAGLDRATRDTLFVAGAYLPPRLQGNALRRPLVLVLPDDDEPTDLLALVPGALPLGTVADEVAYVLLAYRGTTLRVGGRLYTSRASADPYGKDVDDALALAHAVRADIEMGVYPERLVALGLGRGATVALLAAERAAPFQLVVSLEAPTTFFVDGVRDDLRRALLGQPVSRLPGMQGVAAQSALAVRDGARTLAEARLELLARSPLFFAQPPPFHILAFGAFDPRVPVVHGRMLDSRIGFEASLTIETDDTGLAGLLANASLIEATSTRVRALLVPPWPL